MRVISGANNDALATNVVASTAAIATATAFAVGWLWRKWRGRGSRSLVNEVIMFPDRRRANDGLDRLLKHVTSAERSVDVCMFVFTCRRLCDTLIALSSRRRRVRVLLDQTMAAESQGCQLARLCAAGVQVRLVGDAGAGDGGSRLMHHKFAVVDGRRIINGSFNWTRQAAAFNYENIIVTDCAAIVSPFADEFERIWREAE